MKQKINKQLSDDWKILNHTEVLIIMSGLMLGMLLAALDQTIVSTALPTIVGQLGGLNNLSWVVTAYLLSSTVSLPLYGKLGDLYGRKIIYQFAIITFVVGSLLCGIAQSMVQLIIFRAVQGLGGGGLIVIAQAIIGDVVSPRERGRYQGYTGAVFALASIVGPLLGGFFIDYASWRWIFYINLPLGILALVVISSVLKLPYQRVEHRIDYLGSFLLVLLVSCIMLVTVWAGSEFKWLSSEILGLIALGLFSFCLFFLQEHRAHEPVVPFKLFKNDIFRISSLASFIFGMSMFGVIIFLPLYMQVVKGASATNSGLYLLPLMVGMVGGSISSGLLVSKTGKYRIFPLAGAVLLSFGLFLLSQISYETSLLKVSFYILTAGLGMGLAMQVLVTSAQNAVNHSDLGVATSATNFFRSLGASIGTAFFGSILNSQLAINLERFVDPSFLQSSLGVQQILSQSPKEMESLPQEVHAGLIQAFVLSLDRVFLTAVPLALTALVVVWFLREIPLREQVRE
ncbi:MAG: MFS transporter [Myxococcales bacterium]|nr:MFS transporter [Myxococcales bacterium]USN50734.1 MAG: MFS transporter [Myxococcales bacterium]